MAEPTNAASTYPILPLRVGVLFPGQVMPVSVKRPDSTAAIEAALTSEEKTLVIITQRNAEKEKPDFDDLYTVGTLAVIKRMQRVDGTIQAIVQGGTRVRMIQAHQANRICGPSS